MSFKLKSKIILETGEELKGEKCIKDDQSVIGKIIFDTRVVGYEKTLTCPEYKNKIVCLSYPLIGNYGINQEDIESSNIYPAGLIVSEISPIYSNYRADYSFSSFISKTQIPVISQVDTQYITKKVREVNNLWGAIVPSEFDTSKVISEIKAKKEKSLQELPSEDILEEKLPNTSKKKEEITVLNLGVKRSEIFHLQSSGYKIKFINIEEDNNIYKHISSSKSLYITSGSDDYHIINKVCNMLKERVGEFPIFGVGLGHIILGKVLGGKISDNFVNHYGINLPVINCETKKNIITEQMHSLILQKNTLPKNNIRYLHLNDNTVEGLFDKKKKVISVSFIPRREDFQEFFEMLKG